MCLLAICIFPFVNWLCKALFIFIGLSLFYWFDFKSFSYIKIQIFLKYMHVTKFSPLCGKLQSQFLKVKFSCKIAVRF